MRSYISRILESIVTDVIKRMRNLLINCSIAGKIDSQISLYLINFYILETAIKEKTVNTTNF